MGKANGKDKCNKVLLWMGILMGFFSILTPSLPCNGFKLRASVEEGSWHTYGKTSAKLHLLFAFIAFMLGAFIQIITVIVGWDLYTFYQKIYFALTALGVFPGLFVFFYTVGTTTWKELETKTIHARFEWWAFISLYFFFSGHAWFFFQALQ